MPSLTRSGDVVEHRWSEHLGPYCTALTLPGILLAASSACDEQAHSSDALHEGGLARPQHLVDQAVLDGRLGGENLVALNVTPDVPDRPAGVVGDHPLGRE